MKYLSTRGSGTSVSFEEAVLGGLAPDGGLYVPIEIPTISQEILESWKDDSLPQVAFHLFRLYVDPSEISDLDLKRILDKSFATFSHPSVTPLQKLPSIGSGNLEHFWVLELFHGPTFAFKDVALQVLGNLFEFFLDRKHGSARLTVLGATSGDTGGAAIYGLRGKTGIDVFILHPKNRISPVQELQMTTVLDSNVHNVAVEGSFDDCQEIVKTLFSDAPFKAKFNLGAVNSINWARILAQMSYYYYSYFQMAKSLGVTLTDARIQYRYFLVFSFIR